MSTAYCLLLDSRIARINSSGTSGGAWASGDANAARASLMSVLQVFRTRRYTVLPDRTIGASMRTAPANAGLARSASILTYKEKIIMQLKPDRCLCYLPARADRPRKWPGIASDHHISSRRGQAIDAEGDRIKLSAFLRDHV